MDIGTAKPDRMQRERLPHHLIDIKDPDEQYTAGEFVRLADGLCSDFADGGILPVISGGTGFYIRNFVCGTATAPAADPALRADVAQDLALHGAGMLRAELSAADPVSAARIHPNDTYRLTRAVEILRSTGAAPSCFAPAPVPRSCYEFLILGVAREREELKHRIGRRVAAMFDAGLEEEVRTLRRAGYGPENPGLKAIGYREFFEMEGASPGQVADAIELHTVQYAKRQMTFMRALPGIRWIEASVDALAAELEAFFSPGAGPDVAAARIPSAPR
jgi:tRNA dimethylallyltransferase